MTTWEFQSKQSIIMFSGTLPLNLMALFLTLPFFELVSRHINPAAPQRSQRKKVISLVLFAALREIIVDVLRYNGLKY